MILFQEFETFKEKWKKSNDSDIEAVSTLSSTLDQMKERLASMQELLKEKDQVDLLAPCSLLLAP